jgi:hypothetical protein
MLRNITAVPAVAGLVAALVMASPAPAAPAAPDAPGEIAVEAGHKPFLLGHAVGVQIYSCSTTAAGAYAWSSATPRADLYDEHGNAIIHHFGGPSWQAKDGSTVVGARVRGVTADPTAIPWLLLGATPASTSAEGDRLTATTFIQRLSTTGGLPPAAADCNVVTAGSARAVPYTADYLFWKSTGA